MQGFEVIRIMCCHQVISHAQKLSLKLSPYQKISRRAGWETDLGFHYLRNVVSKFCQLNPLGCQVWRNVRGLSQAPSIKPKIIAVKEMLQMRT